ncbi:hypothetical protein Plec18167_005649 [Paecilomyces lecythidis]|uniref:4-coumarate-CoA ligase n=1 Tax=Paecilomyces lecythidis TaxID=3004212 RepID=A0ABR3XGB8_9EURO
MPRKSPHPDIDIPHCSLLSYLFPSGEPVSSNPLWLDALEPSKSLSPAEVLIWIRRLAVGFNKLGIPEGSTIMLMTPNHIYVPVIYLATVGSKRRFTGVNPVFTPEEVAYQLKASKATVFLVHPSILEKGLEAARRVNFPLDRIYQFSDNESDIGSTAKDWKSILASEEESSQWSWDPLLGDTSSKTVAVINFSSGTTGLPKGTCISHRNLVANAVQSIFIRFYTPEADSATNPVNRERGLSFLPLYHAYSQLWTINISCKLGIPTYIMPRFNFEEFLRSVEAYGITSIQVVPPVLIMLSKREESSKYNLQSLKHIMCGAAPLSRELQNEISTRFGMTIAQGWGMTEVVCVGLMVPGFLHDDTGSVGPLLPNCEAMLVDEDGNEVLEEGKPGEVWFRGPQVMLGYLDNEEATKACKTTDGWFKTGDIATFSKGMFTIVDRNKELIKVNGLQVAPAELEALLLQCDGVSDAAVVGININDEERPRAYVSVQPHAKGKLTEDDIVKFVGDRVAKHKRLTGGVSFVDEVPRLASGKIVRKAVKEWAKQDIERLQGKIKSRL